MYPSLNPLVLRAFKAREVIKLMKKIRKYSSDSSSSSNYQHQTSSGVIRRNVTGKRGTGGWI